MIQDVIEKRLTPEKSLRTILFCCLVGTGLAMIYVASHVSRLDTPPENVARFKELTSYFFIALWIFILFYAQYAVVQRFTKVSLSDRFGYAQSLGGAALLLVGALYAALPQTSADVTSGILFWITLLGEGVFLANVVWSYTHGAARATIVDRARSTQPVAPKLGDASIEKDASIKNLCWPKSPAKLFGIGAGFFAAGGVVSLILNFPVFKFPVPWSGEMHFIPFGLLWLSCAVPFAIFAVLYRFLIDSHGLVFEESMNRIHFCVTIIAVLDIVRVFGAWQQTMVSKLAALYFGPEFAWLYVLFGVSALVFAISAYRSHRKVSSRR